MAPKPRAGERSVGGREGLVDRRVVMGRGSEQAVQAHGMLQGDVFLPIHWGLFNLANHGWTEPIERVMAAAEQAGVAVLTPRPGQSVEPTTVAEQERWWPSVPWRTAAEYPIVATKIKDG